MDSHTSRGAAYSRKRAAGIRTPANWAKRVGNRFLGWLQDEWDTSDALKPVVRFWNKHVTFYRLHLTYFIVIAVVGTLLVWLSPKRNGQVPLIDALFGVTSALCVTGLFSLKMEQLSVFDEAVLMVLMLLGSQVFTSLLPVYVRRFYFHRYLRKYIRDRGRLERGGGSTDLQEKVAPVLQTQSLGRGGGAGVGFESPRWSEDEQVQDEIVHHTWSGEMSRKEAQKLAMVRNISKALSARLAEREGVRMSKRMQQGGEGLNEDEEFMDLPTSKTLEHEALTYLSWLVPVYFFGVQIAGFCVVDLYFFGAPHALQSLKERDVNRTFFAMFTSVSAFANAGLTPIDENMVPFRKSVLLLLNYGVLILVGNTLFAPVMRFFIWVLSRVARGKSRAVYKYLLEHPRKCYTHLFPRDQTLWLVLTVMAFNAVEFIAFCALDWRSSALKGLGAGYKVADGLFQSINTRSAGFQVVNLAQLSSAMLVLYVGMMYIAAYPVFLSRQNTKAAQEVYDESDLGVYANNWESELVDSKISVQARNLLARDSAYLFMSVFLICILHNRQTKNDPLNFSIFNIIFEVISAYGNVGLSVGYSCDLARKMQQNIDCKDVPFSFSGKWNSGGKAILVVVMFLGRHRGLPDNIDSAVKLPRRKEFDVKRTRSLSRFRDPVLWTSGQERSSRGGFDMSAPPGETTTTEASSLGQDNTPNPRSAQTLDQGAMEVSESSCRQSNPELPEAVACRDHAISMESTTASE